MHVQINLFKKISCSVSSKLSCWWFHQGFTLMYSVWAAYYMESMVYDLCCLDGIRCTLYDVYAMCTVCHLDCTVCGLDAILGVHYVHCMRHGCILFGLPAVWTCTLYGLHAVCTVRYTDYVIWTVWLLACLLCGLYWLYVLYAISPVCYIDFSLHGRMLFGCTLHGLCAIWSVCYLDCMLHELHATWSMLFGLNAIEVVRYMEWTPCKIHLQNFCRCWTCQTCNDVDSL